TLAPPSLLDHRRRTRSFNGTDSPQVVILPSLPAIHPPGVDEEHPRIPHPLSLSSATSGSDRLGGALRVPGATSSSRLRSVSPIGRHTHPHPLPSPEHDGLAGFAIELVHAAGSNLIYPHLSTRSPAPAGAPGSTPTAPVTRGATSSEIAAHQVATPAAPATAHSLRSLAHQLAGPIMDNQPTTKASGPLEMHRETLMALKDQLNGATPPPHTSLIPAPSVAVGAFPPGLNKRFSAPSFAATN
ncbi:hypothetical protein BCR44DRAFT_35576, partial [Catenaria anguillulae PL171]